jgi:hypothetical protein
MAKPTQPGKFICTVQEAESYVHLNKDDKPSIMLKLYIEAGQGANSGTEIAWFGGLSSDKSREMTQKALKTCFGWDWDSQALVVGNVPFAGKEVEADIQWDEYNGQRRLRVAWINNPEGGQAVSHDPAKLASILGALDRQAKATSRAIAGGTRQPVVPPRPMKPIVRASDPIELEDDDIPF